MASGDMNHMNYIDAVAESDTAVLRKKEASYKGSWKKTGGRSAWMQFERNMTRLQNMLARPEDVAGFSIPDLDDCIQQARMEDDGSGDCTLDWSVVKYLRDSYLSENIFAKIRENPNGNDGTVLACLRDLRRYAILIEAEMISRGVVYPEETEECYHREVPEPPALCGKDGAPIVPGTVVMTTKGVPAVVLSINHKVRTAEVAPGISTPTSLLRWATEAEVQENKRARTILTTDELVQQATPENGSQHETLTPWAVSTSWRHKNGFAPGALDATLFDGWYKQQGPGLYVLEPAVDEASPLTHIRHLYETSGTFSVLKVRDCPPGARDWFPRLRRELNSKERDEAPVWQRGMYRWSENGTKWVIEPEHEAWAIV